MPNLNFQITGVQAAASTLTPLLHFDLAVSNQSLTEEVRAILLQVQIQIQSTRRAYTAREKEKLAELFGPSEHWARTLRNRFWTAAHTRLGRFTNRTKTVLPVSCTFDLNIAAAKYFYALEEGTVPLQFSFSGTVFYVTSDGWLQAEQLPGGKECIFPMAARVWRETMDNHFPNSAWLYLNRDVFDELYAYKRDHGCSSWEETIERLLTRAKNKESHARKPAHTEANPAPSSQKPRRTPKRSHALWPGLVQARFS